tara:strand:+ start:1825 stop:2169 length:345 start_codon:yes stop_codon:yes gene_type:complete
MKKITLKTVTLDSTSDSLQKVPVELKYKDTIMGLLKTPKDPEKGATFEEMAQAMPLWVKFRDESKGVVLLEDAEHKFLVACLKNARFIQRSMEILTMINDVINAPEHLVASKES